MIRQVVQCLADWPSVFDLLRWILEGAYHGHKSVIRNELASRSRQVLDIGCGTGFYAQFFRPDAYIGVDLSPVYIAAARRKHPQYNFLVANACQLPFDANQFSTAMISGVLHHLPDDEAERALAEAARVLSTDGQLVVWEDIPSIAWWNAVGPLIHHLDLGRCIRHRDRYRSLVERHFTIRSERLMRSGFMDYVVFACSPRTPDINASQQSSHHAPRDEP